jgi:SsrA-binding protein
VLYPPGVAAGEHTVVSNRRARHDFEILERVEAGLALQGTEVKSLRAGKVALRDAYALPRDGELWLVGASIEQFAQGNRANHEVMRDRKLLLRRAEIDRLRARVEEKGLTLVPLRIYFKAGRAKAELGLGRGKTGVDRRDTLRDRESQREIERELKARR